jgi:hypothetical protein
MANTSRLRDKAQKEESDRVRVKPEKNSNISLADDADEMDLVQAKNEHDEDDGDDEIQITNIGGSGGKKVGGKQLTTPPQPARTARGVTTTQRGTQASARGKGRGKAIAPNEDWDEDGFDDEV